jgi:hypothetical protein
MNYNQSAKYVNEALTKLVNEPNFWTTNIFAKHHEVTIAATKSFRSLKIALFGLNKRAREFKTAFASSQLEPGIKTRNKRKNAARVRCGFKRRYK